MSWVKLDDQMPDHPKFVQAGTEAAWLFVCGLCYAARHLTDGFIPTDAVRLLGHFQRPAKVAERLVEVGLWTRADGGFAIHDYLDYQPSAEDVKREREKNRGRKGGKRPAGMQPESGRIPAAPTGARTRPTPGPTDPHGGSVVTGGTHAADAAPRAEKTNGHVSGTNGTNGTDLEPLLAAFDRRSLTRPALAGKFEAQDARSLLQAHEPDVIAGCWQDVAAGEWGDERARRDLSFSWLARNNRVGNWQREREAARVETAVDPRLEVIRA